MLSLDPLANDVKRQGDVFGDDDPDHPLHYFWRVDGMHFWHNDGSCYTSIHFHKWYILRRTPAGVWLVPYWCRRPSSKWQINSAEKAKKLVYLNTRRKWAYPTKAEAWNSYMIRQQKRLQHAKNALEVARASLATALEHDKDNPYA